MPVIAARGSLHLFLWEVRPLTDPSVPVVTKGVPVMKTFLTLALVACIWWCALIHSAATGATKAAPLQWWLRQSVLRLPARFPARPGAICRSVHRCLRRFRPSRKTETSPSHETAPALNREYILDQMRALIR